MKEISEELAQTPMGRMLKKALEALGDKPRLAAPLFDMQEQMLPRLRSRKRAFTPSDDALKAFADADAAPHTISLARSHNWYAPALPHDFKVSNEYDINDLRDAARRQLFARQGIAADDNQFDIAGISTMQMARAIIRTTPPGTAILGDTVAWDGYALPPAMEQRPYLTKPEGQMWRDFILEKFENPKDAGVIFITSPHSLTGKLTDPKVLQELFDVSEEFGIKLVLNQVHATPGFNGTLPEPQTSMIANNKSRNFAVMTSTTKQVMPYAVDGLENAQLNVFYAPDPALVAEIRQEVAKVPAAEFNRMAIAPAVIGPAVELLNASNTAFFVNNQQQSQDKRLAINAWLETQKNVEWYNGQMPDTTYHAVLTFKGGALRKNGISSPHQLYDYILFTTGLDVAPIFDSGPNGNKNIEGDASFRMNYSLPEEELALTIKLLDIAAKSLEAGVTLEQAVENSKRPHGVKLAADGSAPAAAATTAAKSLKP